MGFFKSAEFRVTAAVVVLAVVYVLFQTCSEQHNEEGEGGMDGGLRCCIAISSSISSMSSRDVGFSYELLNYYANDTGRDISFTQYTDKSVWDKLARGELDMLVFDFDDDSTSVAKFEEQLVLTKPLRGDIYVVVDKENTALLNSFNFWLNSFKESRTYVLMTNRFFRSYNIESIASTSSRSLSPYEDIIKRYSSFAGLDWVLVSSLAYQESHYRMGSKLGSAQGLMQIKPTTAARYGVEDVYDPELNVKAGTLHLQYLMRLYRDEGLDSLNVIKFALASYNAGEGRIEECRNHAAQAGYNRNDWDQVALSLSSHPTFVGTSTINYVDAILERCAQYKELLK